MPRTLLLADDSLTIQQVIEQTFADEPIDVVAVGDGEAALARLNADPPDVLLADIGMPGRNGYELALHVRRTPALAHIPVILLTGAFDPVDHARAREAGCAGVLVKPFDPQMLIARVRQLLAVRRPLSDAPGDAALPHAGPADVLAPGVALQPPASPPFESVEAARAPAAASRAADVDGYFARLDRAFANLQASSADGATLDPRAAPSAGAPQAEEPTPTDLGSATGSHQEPHPAVDSDPAPAGRPGDAIRSSSAEPPGAPTLGDAFVALLAIEQGRPVPEGAGWERLVTADLVDRVARRVSREISERVVRDLAPDIVSQVAERLVREEIARVKSSR